MSSSPIDRAIILAGGKGTRLKPYTISLPKPLVPIGEMPILEIIIRQLAAAGFQRVTLAVNTQVEIIKAYFADGSKWNLHIDYSLETMPLGTMGPLTLLDDLPENFLVMNGDILTDLSYHRLCQTHFQKEALFTIAATDRIQHIDYGVLQINDAEYLCGFQEKPRLPYLVSMGIYCVNRAVLQWLPVRQSRGFDQLMLDLLHMKKPVAIHKHSGYWLDIGRPDDYERAIQEWPQLAPRYTPNAAE